MFLIYYFAYLALLSVFSTVNAEISQNVPFIILFKKDLTQTTLENLLKSALKTKQKNVQDMRAGADEDDFTENYDMHSILELVDLKNNLLIRQNNQVTNNISNSKSKNDDNSAEFRKSNWRGSCNKKAAKQCQKACVQALKSTCGLYKCTRRFKKTFKRECKSSCKSKFLSYSSDRSDSDFDFE